jgi:hypothetical protein
VARPPGIKADVSVAGGERSEIPRFTTLFCARPDAPGITPKMLSFVKSLDLPKARKEQGKNSETSLFLGVRSGSF